MKNIALALSVLVLAAVSAGAHGRGAGGRSSGGKGGFSARGHFSRPLTKPTFARASGGGIASRTGFAPSGRANGRSAFGGAKMNAAAGAGTPGGGTGSTSSTPAAAPPYAVPGAKILTMGQQPVYSTPSGGGTQSVQGGGFIAIDQSHANDVGRGPGVTWGAPDRTPSSGAASGGGGSGGSSNGPAFDPSF